LYAFEDGEMQAVAPDAFSGKLTIISVMPSLDTPVCQIQTKKFNEQLGELGSQINAVTVSLNLPFAINRFCRTEGIESL